MYMTPKDAGLFTKGSKASRGERLAKKKILEGMQWTDIVTLMELKICYSANVHVQLGTYLDVLPRALPNLAGMLALTCDKDRINYHWSDNSEVVRTATSFHSDGEDGNNEYTDAWVLMCSYIYTLYYSKDNLVPWDETMTLDGNSWAIETSKQVYRTGPIHLTSHHSRQTCVFGSEAPVRVLKDIWTDDARRHHEGEILETVKGTPGVVQVDYSEKVPAYKVDPVTGEKTTIGDLETSQLHSGNDCELEPLRNRGRTAPRRTKWRHVYHTKGETLKARTPSKQVSTLWRTDVQGKSVFIDVRRVSHLSNRSSVSHEQRRCASYQSRQHHHKTDPSRFGPSGVGL
jgi:hypothetical protein